MYLAEKIRGHGKQQMARCFGSKALSFANGLKITDHRYINIILQNKIPVQSLIIHSRYRFILILGTAVFAILSAIKSIGKLWSCTYIYISIGCIHGNVGEFAMLLIEALRSKPWTCTVNEIANKTYMNTEYLYQDSQFKQECIYIPSQLFTHANLWML